MDTFSIDQNTHTRKSGIKQFKHNRLNNLANN